MSYHSGSARGVGSAGHSCTPGHGVHGQIADGPVLATPAGGSHGVTLRALRYLIEATSEACDAALGEGPYAARTALPVDAPSPGAPCSSPYANQDTPPPRHYLSPELVLAVEAARAAAAMVEGLIVRAAERHASPGAFQNGGTGTVVLAAQQ